MQPITRPFDLPKTLTYELRFISAFPFEDGTHEMNTSRGGDLMEVFDLIGVEYYMKGSEGVALYDIDHEHLGNLVAVYEDPKKSRYIHKLFDQPAAVRNPPGREPRASAASRIIRRTRAHTEPARESTKVERRRGGPEKRRKKNPPLRAAERRAMERLLASECVRPSTKEYMKRMLDRHGEPAQRNPSRTKNWSSKVKTHWSPPRGFFNQSAIKIARGLEAASRDYKQAMSRLTFYINRAGSDLSPAARNRLELAKHKLRKIYGRV